MFYKIFQKIIIFHYTYYILSLTVMAYGTSLINYSSLISHSNFAGIEPLIFACAEAKFIENTLKYHVRLCSLRQWRSCFLIKFDSWTDPQIVVQTRHVISDRLEPLSHQYKPIQQIVFMTQNGYILNHFQESSILCLYLQWYCLSEGNTCPFLTLEESTIFNSHHLSDWWWLVEFIKVFEQFQQYL